MKERKKQRDINKPVIAFRMLVCGVNSPGGFVRYLLAERKLLYKEY